MTPPEIQNRLAGFLVRFGGYSVNPGNVALLLAVFWMR